MKKLGELMMILDLHRQGVKIAVIARQVGVDRKTVRLKRPPTVRKSARRCARSLLKAAVRLPARRRHTRTQGAHHEPEDALPAPRE